MEKGEPSMKSRGSQHPPAPLEPNPRRGCHRGGGHRVDPTPLSLSVLSFPLTPAQALAAAGAIKFHGATF